MHLSRLLSTLVGLYACLTPVLARLPLTPNRELQVDRKDSDNVQHGLGVKNGKTRSSALPVALHNMLEALEVMQEQYFDIFAGTWPEAIDWTAAVMGTHVSSTLATLVQSFDSMLTWTCTESVRWENTVSQYFAQLSFFYYGENAFALRNQAYDDMLWVVLGWLENIKFSEMYASKHWDFDGYTGGSPWHGAQMVPMAAHRARIFYELASVGWDTSLCGGGMTWNPALTPYKNAITNELFAAASIEMYLYHPGDENDAPFLASGKAPSPDGKPHDPQQLENAVKSYKWLKESHMKNQGGLYQDGYHITGWRRYPNGTINRGTGECDELNTMVYTYNQGVMLSASRGLWLATGSRSYLDDGHDLISSVIRATGWPNTDYEWRGLGRAGIMEEFCDRGLYCSQDGQTFKGIFFHHLTEFCRPLWPSEEKLASTLTTNDIDKQIYQLHLARCAAYGKWIEHNAAAAMRTRNNDGLFGMWWGAPQRRACGGDCEDAAQDLPSGSVDYRNPLYFSSKDFESSDLNDRGRGRTVETQSGGLAVLRAHWQWEASFN